MNQSLDLLTAISKLRASYVEKRDHSVSGAEHHHACVAIAVIDEVIADFTSVLVDAGKVASKME